jgi:hypothetical protein
MTKLTTFNRQGLVMGTAQSMASLFRAFGPMVSSFFECPGSILTKIILCQTDFGINIFLFCGSKIPIFIVLVLDVLLCHLPTHGN